MRTFRINRRVIADQVVYVRAKTFKDAINKMEHFEEPLAVLDQQVKHTTYRSLGEDFLGELD